MLWISLVEGANKTMDIKTEYLGSTQLKIRGQVHLRRTLSITKQAGEQGFTMEVVARLGDASVSDRSINHRDKVSQY
jgi:hypothetical protein